MDENAPLVKSQASIESGQNVQENTKTEKDDKDMDKPISSAYTTKKSATQGLLDISLLTANISMASFILEQENLSRIHIARLTLLFLSVILQVLMGITITILGFMSMRTKDQVRKAEVLNNTVVVFSMLITVVNIVTGALSSDINKHP